MASTIRYNSYQGTCTCSPAQGVRRSRSAHSLCVSEGPSPCFPPARSVHTCRGVGIVNSMGMGRVVFLCLACFVRAGPATAGVATGNERAGPRNASSMRLLLVRGAHITALSQRSMHALGIERRLNGDDYDNGSVRNDEIGGNTDFADTAAADSVSYNGDNGGNEQGRADGDDGDLGVQAGDSRDNKEHDLGARGDYTESKRDQNSAGKASTPTVALQEEEGGAQFGHGHEVPGDATAAIRSGSSLPPLPSTSSSDNAGQVDDKFDTNSGSLYGEATQGQVDENADNSDSHTGVATSGQIDETANSNAGGHVPEAASAPAPAPSSPSLSTPKAPQPGMLAGGEKQPTGVGMEGTLAGGEKHLTGEGVESGASTSFSAVTMTSASSPSTSSVSTASQPGMLASEEKATNSNSQREEPLDAEVDNQGETGLKTEDHSGNERSNEVPLMVSTPTWMPTPKPTPAPVPSASIPTPKPAPIHDPKVAVQPRKHRVSASEKAKAGRKEADDIDDVDTHREDAIAASLSKRAAKVKMGQELLAALIVVVFAAILYRRWRSQQQFSAQPRELALPTFDSFAFDEGDQTGSESFDKSDDASDSFAEGFELPEMSAVDIDGLAEEEAGFGAAGGAVVAFDTGPPAPSPTPLMAKMKRAVTQVRHKGAKTHEPLPAEDDSEDFFL